MDAKDHIGTLVPIDLMAGQRWIMFVTAPEEEAVYRVTDLMKAMLWVALGCLLVAAVFILFLSKRLAAPIGILRDECLLLAQGDLRQKAIRITSHDEIGQLGNGFSQMRHKLNSIVVDIEDAAKRVSENAAALAEGAQQTGGTAVQVALTIAHIAESASKQAGRAEQIREKSDCDKRRCL